jgi:hypothetical protein
MSEPTNPVTPEDVLPDGVEGGDFNGTYVRKGTVAAFIANAKMLDDLQRGSAEYEAVAGHIRSMKPALEAAGLFDVFEIRNPAVAEILDRQ